MLLGSLENIAHHRLLLQHTKELQKLGPITSATAISHLELPCFSGAIKSSKFSKLFKSVSKMVP